MPETSELLFNTQKIPREIERYLEPIRQGNFETFTIMFLGSGLKRLNITPETQPEMLRQIGEVLKPKADAYFLGKIIPEVNDQMQDSKPMAHQAFKQAFNDLMVFRLAGVDIKPYAEALLATITSLDKDEKAAQKAALTKAWIVRPFEEKATLEHILAAMPTGETKATSETKEIDNTKKLPVLTVENFNLEKQTAKAA